MFWHGLLAQGLAMIKAVFSSPVMALFLLLAASCALVEFAHGMTPSLAATLAAVILTALASIVLALPVFAMGMVAAKK